MSFPQAFTPIGNTLTIAASGSSASGTLAQVNSATNPVNCLRIFNASTGIAFWVVSETANPTAAVATSTPVMPNSVEVFTIDPSAAFAAVILSTGTGNVYFTRGEGQ